MWRAGILMLGLNERVTHVDGCEFVFTDPVSQDLHATTSSVEFPFSVDTDERHRERPFLISDCEGHTIRIRWILNHAQFLLCQSDELCPVLFILSRISGLDHILTGGSEYLAQSGSI